MKITAPAVTAAVLALLFVAAPAGAAGKHRVVVDRFADSYELGIDCSEFGPYEFENLVVGHERVLVTDVFASDGELLQTVFSMGLRETDSNADTGASITLSGRVYEIWDYRDNTRTMSGKVYQSTDAGGLLVHEVGRIVMTLDTHEASFVAGPHDAFFAGGIDPLVCGLLA